MAMYDRGLTAAEIAARPQRGAAAKLEGEVAWWPMDQSAGPSAPDVSGSGINATLVNMDNSDWVDDGDRRVLDFDGTDDHLTLGAAESLADINGKDRFVMNVQFMPREVSRQQAIYSAGGNVIRIDGGNIVAQVLDANSSSTVYRGNQTLVANQWYDLRFIFHQNPSSLVRQWRLGLLRDP